MLKTAAPQVVTLAGVLAALLAIVWAPSRPYWACNAIIASCLCDMVDGRIARALGVQSQFGAELDSLADVIAFGVAPAMLAYHTALANGSKYLVSPWLIASFLFSACSALRLARFNTVLDTRENADEFQGIPTPVSALLVTTTIMTCHELKVTEILRPSVMGPVLLISGLLGIVRVRFPSYKRFRSRFGQILFYGSILGGLTLLVLGGPGGTVLLGLMLLYVVRSLIVAARHRVRVSQDPSPL
jgi:CDP-diacylglycerol--serine O-phosphatidyltransferase